MLDEDLGLGPRNEHARTHRDLESTETSDAREVLKGLPRDPATCERVRSISHVVVEIPSRRERPFQGCFDKPASFLLGVVDTRGVELLGQLRDES